MKDRPAVSWPLSGIQRTRSSIVAFGEETSFARRYPVQRHIKLVTKKLVSGPGPPNLNASEARCDERAVSN
jgi:hypothetical protein